MQYQGNELKDTDLPTYVEAKLFSTTFGKLIWVSLMPFFYSLRPLAVYPKPPLVMDALNAIVQFAFDGFVWYYFGIHTHHQTLTELNIKRKKTNFRRAYAGVFNGIVLLGNGLASDSSAFSLGTLHVQKRLRNVQLLRAFKLVDVEHWVPQRAPRLPLGSRLDAAGSELFPECFSYFVLIT